MHAIAGKAVCFGEALKPEFKVYGSQIVANAKAMAASLQQSGLRMVSGGTDNHLILVDLQSIGLTGQAAEVALGSVGVTVNKNAIPNDPQPPRVTSGLRLGTPSVTARGFKEAECQQVAQMIVKILNHPDENGVIAEVRDEVEELTGRFPVPGLDY